MPRPDPTPARIAADSRFISHGRAGSFRTPSAAPPGNRLIVRGLLGGTLRASKRDVSLRQSDAGGGVEQRTASLCDPLDVENRLLDVAANQTMAEFIVVVRGTIRPWRERGRGLWRVQLPDGQHRVVSTESVLAVTPLSRRARLVARPSTDPRVDR